MVDWNSPQELAIDAQAFSNLIHVLFGLYLWEYCISVSFDYAFLTGKRKFRWPLTFYFIGRYCLLAALIGIIIALNVHSKLNCQGLYTFNQCMGNIAIGMASVNLSLRTMAVWGQKWYIVGPLVAISLGHWSLLLHGILLTATFIPGQGCVITSTDSKLLSATFIYSMTFDFIVLLLTAFKLARPSGGKSQLVNMIFADGLYYFVIAFLSNLVATVFMTLNLNAVMSIIANVPAAIASTIVASRVVRRLANYSTTGAEKFASTVNGSSGFRSHGQPSVAPQFAYSKQQPGVHVQMNTFSEPMTYDAEGHIIKSGDLDPEAQQISDEFKHPSYPG
ncbi:hypothetical protein BC834DRAFT_969516 [Gloeopeniophorella convolvens]|nr:hypothetical protein BC834DRAFT_969516 [Gloeopeniophorella convolvens]